MTDSHYAIADCPSRPDLTEFQRPHVHNGDRWVLPDGKAINLGLEIPGLEVGAPREWLGVQNRYSELRDAPVTMAVD